MRESPADGSTALIVWTTLNEEEAARRLARRLLEARLAGCVTLLPGLLSIYWWEGKIAEEPEILLMIKTTPNSLPALRELIAREHPYETPELLVVDAKIGAPAYAAWLAGAVAPRAAEDR